MTKTIKRSKTRTGGGGGLSNVLPSERSQLVPHQVPDFTSKSAGLEGLGQVLNGFLEQALSAGATMQRTLDMVALKRIEQENAAQKAAAQADFFSGKEANPELTGDLDYYETYRDLSANKAGLDAANDFRKWYLEIWLPENPTGDVAAARDEWIKTNLTGAEDPAFTAQAAASFVQATDELVANQRTNAVKIQIEMGLQNLDASIAADAQAGNLTPERVTYYLQAARTLNPLAPQEAAPRVAAAIQQAIRLNPDKSFSILSALEHPGTGVNGKSFAESFPEQYADLQENAVKDWQSVNTMEEMAAYDDLEEKARGFEKMTDEDLADWAATLMAIKGSKGGGARANALMDAYTKEIDRRADHQVTISQVGGMLAGAIPMDASYMRENLMAFMKDQLGIDNILQADPVEVAEILVRAKGVVPEDVRVQISSALTSFENPAIQAAAAAIITELNAARDFDYTKKYLTDDAARYAEVLIMDQMVSTNDMMASINRINTIRRDTKPVTWQQLVPEKTEATVQAEVQNAVNEALNVGGWGPFGRRDIPVKIPPDVANMISDYALIIASEQAGYGVGWQDAIKSATSNMLDRLEVLPQSGGYVLDFDADRSPVYERTDGTVQERVRLGFDVNNPKTGETVNTVEVYESELKSARRTAPFLFDENTNVSLASHPYASDRGAYMVVSDRDGPTDPVVLRPGETFKFERFRYLVGRETVNEEVTIPVDGNELAKVMEPILPRGFGFIKIQLSDGTFGWMLSYRPNFGVNEGLSLDERADKWDEDNPPEVVVGPTTIVDPVTGIPEKPQ